MPKIKIHEIDGVRYHVAPLCQAQEDILVEIFGEIGILDLSIRGYLAKSNELDLPVDDVLKNLGRKRLIPRLLATLLVPVNEKFDESKLPETEKIMAGQSVALKFEVWPDFLSVAGTYKKQLIRIFPSLKKINWKQLTDLASAMNASSTISAEETSQSGTPSGESR